jgi:hypothetical protein
MAVSYSYQSLLAGAPTLTVTLADGLVSGTALEKPTPPVPPAAVRESSKALTAWYRQVAQLEPPPRAAYGRPFQLSLASDGASGRLVLTFQSGKLTRKTTFDPKAGVLTTDAAPAFDGVPVPAWLAMHAGYQLFCDVCEAGG